MSETFEETKELSKNELKKLAKKAEKDAAKSAATKERQVEADITNNSSSSSSQSPPSSSSSPVYRLANVPPTGPNDAATLKVCMASVLTSIPLLPAGTCQDDSLSFLHGPALLYGELTSSSPVVAFGGNGIVRALTLASQANSHATQDHAANSTTRTMLTDLMDDWMEYERTELRPALTSNNQDAIQAAFQKLEAALERYAGTSVVGTHPFTAADVVITISILHAAMGPSTNTPLISTLIHASPIIQAYVDHTKHSKEYAQAKALAKTMLPPPGLDSSDPSLLRASSAIFIQAISSICPFAISLGIEVKAFKCKDIKHGDYQCNAAMPLFQKLKALGALPKGVHTPQQMAQAIMDAIPERNPILCDFTINGPGFIMSRIQPTFLEKRVNHILQTGALPKPKLYPSHSSPLNTKQIVIVDFSSPNIAKEMHVGHLRSTIIGESICRILEYVGHDVKRVNHVGDWGTQFGMLIQYLKEEYSVDFHTTETDTAIPNITDLTEFYKNAKQRFDDNPEFKKISQLNVVKLQAGDEECRKIWQVLCDVSRKEFEKVYERLDITVEECGESFYNDKIPAVIEEFTKEGLISVEEGGAKCVFVPKFKIPLMLQKSDGGYGYDSTDMAAIKYRLHDIGASHIVYITDFTQGDHFQMVFAAAKKIGWVTEDSHRLDHIGFGTVQGEDGKRFKTRSGDTVRLVDLLDEAVSRMESSLKERSIEGKANISEDEIHTTACAMGYGAVKYFDLRRNPTSNYIFSYDRMLDTRGNTAVYLLYAHARLESIITKGKAEYNIDIETLVSEGEEQIVLTHKSERNLGLHLQFFADSVEETLNDLFPYHICDFLYALSIAASEFVTQCKVLGSPEMKSRLLLCRTTAITMRQCFDLLGIRYVMRI